MPSIELLCLDAQELMRDAPRAVRRHAPLARQRIDVRSTSRIASPGQSAVRGAAACGRRRATAEAASPSEQSW